MSPTITPSGSIWSADGCRWCPRACGAARHAGAAGRCGESDVCRVAQIGAHFGEEPPLTGRRGSGAVFFTGCACRCFFCQNHQISTGGAGRTYPADELFDAVHTLAKTGVHNLNFVTADHVWPHVARLCARLRAAAVTLPFVFNSSGYHRPDHVPAYAEWMDIFLPDFKFADPDLARTVMGDERYPRLALESLQRMVAARGFLEPWDPTGATVARRGVLVRHLVLPGAVNNSLAVVRLLREEFGRYLPLSLMSQYRPVAACAGRGDFARRVTAEEYRRVTEEVERLGFEQVFIQPDVTNDDFLPDFSRPQPFRGNPPPVTANA